MKRARRVSHLSSVGAVAVALWIAAVLGGLVVLSGCEQTTQNSPVETVVAEVNQTGNLHAQALQILRSALTDDNPLARVNAVEVVAETRQIRLMPKVSRLMMDEHVPVRFAAALAIGDVQYALGRSAVVQLLKDPDVNVKIAAAYAMVKLGQPEYLQVLRKATMSQDQTVRANAVLLLGKCKDREALRYLYTALRAQDSEDKVIYQAAEAIARLGDERIYPKLWTMLISAHWDVRLMGVRAMGALGTTDAKNALVTMLDDDILEVRLAAAEQLAELGDISGEADVLEILEQDQISKLESKWQERAKVLAALAIGQINTPAVKAFLPRFLQDSSMLVRIAAAKAVLLSEQ